jgi:enoyl-CoA hydratase/carnithine racemase
VEYDTIAVEKSDRVGKIVLSRPEVLNAMTTKLVDELTKAVIDLAGDSEVRVVVLTGAGRAFCAGADLKEGFSGTRTEPGSGAEEIRQELKTAQIISYTLHSMEKPSIALVNGVAAGGGMDWALACDMRIGCEHTRFMSAYIRIGAFSGLGGTWLLPRLVGIPKAVELLFTGDFLDAEEAYRMGLLNKLVPSEKLQEEGMALARKIALGPPIAMKLTKMLIYKGLNMEFQTALQMAAACETITLTSEDRKEGVKAFLEKRTPQFKGK